MIQGLPDRLQTLRSRYGYTQKHVADILRVSPSIVSGYETGERTPSTEVLLSLSDLYRCSVDYLLGKQKAEPNLYLDVSGLSDQQIQALLNLIRVIAPK